MRNLSIRVIVIALTIVIWPTGLLAQNSVQFRVLLSDIPGFVPDVSGLYLRDSAMVEGLPLICGYTWDLDRPGVSGYSAYVYDHSGEFVDPTTTFLGANPATNFWDAYDLIGPPEEWCKDWDDPTVHESYDQIVFFGINSNGIVCGVLWSDTATPQEIPIYLDLNSLAGILQLERIPLPAGAAGGRAFKVNANDEIAVCLYDSNGGDLGPYIYKPAISGNKEERIEIPALAGMRLWEEFNPLWQFIGQENEISVRHTLGSAALLEETNDFKRLSVESVTTESFAELSLITGLNSWGAFAGHLRISKGRDKGEYGVRYAGLPALEERRWSVETGWASNVGMVRAMNDSGDVVGNRRDSNGNYTYYYHEAGIGSEDDQYFPTILDLIEPDSDPDFNFRAGEGSDGRVGELLTDADSSGFGWLCGTRNVDTQGERFYLLQPIFPEAIPGISITPSAGLETSEDNGTASFEIVLNTQPEADVRIELVSSNTSEGTVDKESLSFTPLDWNESQTVTIIGVDDAEADGDVSYVINTLPASSTDSAYDGFDPVDVTVTNLDNDGTNGGGKGGGKGGGRNK